MDINVQELHKRLAAGEKLTLIDVREVYENQEFNIGGDLIPLGQLMNRMYELEDHKDDEVIVYCRSGNRSGMAQALMQAQGFKNVRNLTGGMLAWRDTFGDAKI